MARYAIMADIHSNAEALQSVLQDLAAESIDQILVGGDVVGYGADPGACLNLLKSSATVIVAGNHDWGVAGKRPLADFSGLAALVIKWTQTQLSAEQQKFLGELPLVYNDQSLTLVHGSLKNPQDFNYLYNMEDAADCLRRLNTGVCFVGHTHWPYVYSWQDNRVVRLPFKGKVVLSAKAQYVVNVGSVGQPRDGQPLAAYCIFDSVAQAVTLRRVAYPIAVAQEKIRQAGLPEHLASRLGDGF